MIGKGKAIAHGRIAIEYALSKKDAELIDLHHCYGETAGELSHEFGLYHRHHPNVINNILRFEISPDNSNSKSFTREDWKHLSDEFIKKMGLDNHQTISVVHRDTDNPHLHIIANRVDIDCRLKSDSFIGKSSSTAADQIAQTFHLRRAKDVENERKASTKEARGEIYSKFQAVKRSGFSTFEEFKEKMQQKGITVQESINSEGKIQGYRVQSGGNDFKASEVHRDMSFNKIKDGCQAERIINQHKGFYR